MSPVSFCDFLSEQMLFLLLQPIISEVYTIISISKQLWLHVIKHSKLERNNGALRAFASSSSILCIPETFYQHYKFSRDTSLLTPRLSILKHNSIITTLDRAIGIIVLSWQVLNEF